MHRSTRLTYTIAFLSTFFCTLFGYSQYYTFKKFNHRNSLNTEATLSSAQDDMGYIWVGTDGGGLMRFDGNRFTEIGNYSSANAFHVSCINPVSTNEIYFSTLFDGIYHLKNGKYNFVYKPISVGDTRSISIIDSNFVIVSDREIQLVTKKGKLLKTIHHKNGEFFKIIQIVKIPNAVLLFTNQGCFTVLKNHILPLTNWLKKYDIPKDVDFATFHKNRLTLIHGKGLFYTEISVSNFGSPIKIRKGITHLKYPLSAKPELAAERNGMAYLFVGGETIYQFENNSFQQLHINSRDIIDRIDGMMIDNNKNLWLNNMSGLYKVSQEPFTKINSSPELNTNGITFYYHIKSTNTDIVSTVYGSTYIGSISNRNPFQKVKNHIYGICESKYGIFLATDDGIYQLKGNELVAANFPLINGKKCSMIFFDGEEIWYSEFGAGLVRYNPKTKQHQAYKALNPRFPNYFYTAQADFTSKTIYFGSNNCIWKFDKQHNKFTQLTTFAHFGSYCGNSVKDKFGTMWFTLDKALVGITKSDEFVSISNPKKLPSTLFYTLNSDQYGNLLVGTNKGINVIKVDENGNVLKQQNYSHFEGFEGYETNMRASYQSGNMIFVGTIEGLFQINSTILENYPVPPKPQILKLQDVDASNIYNNKLNDEYIFSCILPKSKGISYSYRLLGFSNKWSNLTTINKIALPDLENGKYILEVRATYDGIHFSPTARETITINLPLYKNKWFLVLIVVLLGILNIGFLEWSKTYSGARTIDTNVLAIDIQLIPRLLVFSILASVGLPLLVNTVQTEIHIDTLFIAIQTGILLVLYVFTRYALQQNRWVSLITRSAYATYATLILGSFYLIYMTNIHPYPVILLCILTSVLPFLIGKIRIVIFISILQLVISFSLVILLNDTNYNEVLFLVAVAVSSALVVIFSYVRLDSLEKLIFVNGIINRGNVISLSFDQDGIITYCSRNISEYLKFDSDMITGKPTSVFNEIVVDEEIRESKISEMFVDGKTINIPMIDKHGKLIWTEWACKQLSKQVRVIMGQDVTEKLMISNNYQSLVENAKDMIFNTDINGNFLFVNEYTKKILGYREESLIGKNSVSLIVPEYQEKVQEFYTNQFSSRTKYTYLEYPIRNKDGKVFWLGQNLTLLFEPGSRDRISGFIALSRDITERRANDLLLEQQNKEIASSIDAAKRIQFNLLPAKETFESRFEESFIFFKPKDIVSGDFYWVEHVGNKTIVALADCTGHGISGAFLTILGFNLLNQIVLERKITDASGIVEEMGVLISAALKEEVADHLHREMDLLVAVFEENTLQFSSNGVGLIHQNAETLQHYKNTYGDKHLHPENTTITLNVGDQIYLLTDGYQKQFGAISGKKFGSKRVHELMRKIQPEQLILQKKYIENAIRNWSEGHEQTDDITVIGLKNFKSTVRAVDQKPNRNKRSDEA